MIRRTALVAAAVALLAILGACSGAASGAPGSARTGEPAPFALCPDPSGAGPISPAAATPAGPTRPAGTRTLPSVTLPCFAGGKPVDLAHLGRPAVVNFWASDCPPCRQEMPELERFATAMKSLLVVIGVDTLDRRSAAASAAVDFGASYPSLFDSDGLLLRAWGRNVLPVTLLVDATGVVQHEYVGAALTQSTLDDLVERYLGITP
jgi:thiol-disulfide isomerase/thioredoxin